MLVDINWNTQKLREFFNHFSEAEIKFVNTEDQKLILFKNIVEDDPPPERAWFTYGFERIEKGVYYSDLNPHLYLEILYPNLGELEFYGVADYPQQILEYSDHIDILESPTENYVLVVTPIHKEDEPSQGGWRWHKWGPYIGTERPQCEYLYDEPLIRTVYIFRFYNLGVVEEC